VLTSPMVKYTFDGVFSATRIDEAVIPGVFL
jgi:hypothetical protein